MISLADSRICESPGAAYRCKVPHTSFLGIIVWSNSTNFGSWIRPNKIVQVVSMPCYCFLPFEDTNLIPTRLCVAQSQCALLSEIDPSNLQPRHESGMTAWA